MFKFDTLNHVFDKCMLMHDEIREYHSTLTKDCPEPVGIKMGTPTSLIREYVF